MASVEVQSDVTGTVWKIEVKEGDAVAEGDALMILESMKMEIPVVSTDAGTVVKILVAEEEPVAEGQAVALLEV